MEQLQRAALGVGDPAPDDVVREAVERLLALVDGQPRRGAREPQRDVAALPAVPVAELPLRRQPVLELAAPDQLQLLARNARLLRRVEQPVQVRLLEVALLRDEREDGLAMPELLHADAAQLGVRQRRGAQRRQRLEALRHKRFRVLVEALLAATVDRQSRQQSQPKPTVAALTSRVSSHSPTCIVSSSCGPVACVQS